MREWKHCQPRKHTVTPESFQLSIVRWWGWDLRSFFFSNGWILPHYQHQWLSVIVGDKMSSHLCGYECSMIWLLLVHQPTAVSPSVFQCFIKTSFKKNKKSFTFSCGLSDGKAPPLCLLPPAFFIWHYYQLSHWGCRSFPGEECCEDLRHSHTFQTFHSRQRGETFSRIRMHHHIWAINGYGEYYLGQWHSQWPWGAWLEVKTWFIPSN